VPHAGVPADQDELLEAWARARGLEEPEEALDRHVHDRLGRLLARREVEDVRHSRERVERDASVFDRTADHLEARARRELPIVAESANDEPLVTRFAQ
jgi:hypothetical protein